MNRTWHFMGNENCWYYTNDHTVYRDDGYKIFPIFIDNPEKMGVIEYAIYKYSSAQQGRRFAGQTPDFATAKSSCENNTTLAKD